MSLGPITIFDKSALQALNPDEACWFGHFYRANITPLFFVETLADIEKAVARGRTPEQVVGSLAYKTPSLGALPNVNHVALCLGELGGSPVEMRRFPVVPMGRKVITGDQRGIILSEPPEMVALRRWQAGEFLEVERQFARAWRRSLSALDLALLSKWLRAHVEARPIRDLADAKAVAEQALRRDGHRYRTLKSILTMLGVAPEVHPQIVARWKSLGSPPLPEFASYTAHVVTVDLFFYLALAAGLIAGGRASNRVDIAYLYYLPFCMVFVSKDRLHEMTAPLFLGEDQVFVRGSDLKADLGKLDAHYAELPEPVREQGIMRFAPNPPLEPDYLATRLWDRFLPGWRENAATRIVRSPEADRKIIDHVKRMKRAAGHVDPRLDTESADFLMVEMRAPIRMGKWRLLPSEVDSDAST